MSVEVSLDAEAAGLRGRKGFSRDKRDDRDEGMVVIAMLECSTLRQEAAKYSVERDKGKSNSRIVRN
jgi:hypothetical protein